MSDLLPLQCKDLAFARNLVAQMKEGRGRHDSRRDYQNTPTSGVRGDTPAIGDRIVGRIGVIRTDPCDCKLGEFTSYFTSQGYAQSNIRVIQFLPPSRALVDFDSLESPTAMLPEPWTFERVRWIDDITKVLWKRIS